MTTLTSPITIAIAGLGDVSHLHKRAIDMCNNARLAGVWTRDRGKLTTLSRQWNVRSYPDYDALLDDDTIGAVDITVDDPLHYEFALCALEAGKHVIVENPPADTPGQVLEMKEAADKNGLWCIPCKKPSTTVRAIKSRSSVAPSNSEDVSCDGGMTNVLMSESAPFPAAWR